MRRILTTILLGLLLVIGGAAAWLYTPDAERGPLEARWAPPPSQFLDVAGLRLHLRDTGPTSRPPSSGPPSGPPSGPTSGLGVAPPIILLHGFASSLHAWEDWAPALQASRRMIRFDLPGFGLTGADPTGDYSDARAHAVIIALMDRLGLAQADIVGSSMGGRIAWSFAAAHPGRVRKLVLLAPDGFASPSRAYNQPPGVPWLLRILPYTLPDFMLRPSIRPAYAQPDRIPETTFARYRAMMLAPGARQAIVDRAGQDSLVPPEPLLARITAPTLLLWGSEDAMVPARNAQDYLRHLPDARLVVLPGVGHVPMEEAAEDSVGVVLEFLGG